MSIKTWALRQWAKVFQHDASVPSAWPEWLAKRDPNDVVDSAFLRTTGITFPLPDEARVPGEDTHAMYKRELEDRYGRTLMRRLNADARKENDEPVP